MGTPTKPIEEIIQGMYQQTGPVSTPQELESSIGSIGIEQIEAFSGEAATPGGGIRRTKPEPAQDASDVIARMDAHLRSLRGPDPAAIPGLSDQARIRARRLKRETELAGKVHTDLLTGAPQETAIRSDLLEAPEGEKDYDIPPEAKIRGYDAGSRALSAIGKRTHGYREATSHYATNMVYDLIKSFRFNPNYGQEPSRETQRGLQEATLGFLDPNKRDAQAKEGGLSTYISLREAAERYTPELEQGEDGVANFVDAVPALADFFAHVGMAGVDPLMDGRPVDAANAVSRALLIDPILGIPETIGAVAENPAMLYEQPTDVIFGILGPFLIMHGMKSGLTRGVAEPMTFRALQKLSEGKKLGPMEERLLVGFAEQVKKGMEDQANRLVAERLRTEEQAQIEALAAEVGMKPGQYLRAIMDQLKDQEADRMAFEQGAAREPGKGTVLEAEGRLPQEAIRYKDPPRTFEGGVEWGEKYVFNRAGDQGKIVEIKTLPAEPARQGDGWRSDALPERKIYKVEVTDVVDRNTRHERTGRWDHPDNPSYQVGETHWFLEHNLKPARERMARPRIEEGIGTARERRQAELQEQVRVGREKESIRSGMEQKILEGLRREEKAGTQEALEGVSGRHGEGVDVAGLTRAEHAEGRQFLQLFQQVKGEIAAEEARRPVVFMGEERRAPGPSTRPAGTAERRATRQYDRETFQRFGKEVAEAELEARETLQRLWDEEMGDSRASGPKIPTNPEFYKALVRLGAIKMRKGAVKPEDFAAAMSQDHGRLWEAVSDKHTDIFEAAKAELPGHQQRQKQISLQPEKKSKEQAPPPEPEPAEVKTQKPDKVDLKSEEFIDTQIPLADLNLDPTRMQYKLQTDAQGRVLDHPLFKEGARFKQELADPVLIWKDPVDGKWYVVDGHQRTIKAKMDGIENIKATVIPNTVYETAADARAFGALKNIAGERGKPVDAAKFFRDKGATIEDLPSHGISPRGAWIEKGLALSRLDDFLFNQVVHGSFPEGRGVIIGEKLANHADQRALIKLIETETKKGRNVTNDVVANLADKVRNAGKVQEKQTDLFGTEVGGRNLAVEEARIEAAIQRHLKRRKKLLGGAGREQVAAILEEAGSHIEREASKGLGADAAQNLYVFGKLKESAGPLKTAIREAAERIAEGQNEQRVIAELLERLPDLVQESLGRRTPAEVTPTGDSAGQGRSLFETDTTPEGGGGEGLKPPPPATGTKAELLESAKSLDKLIEQIDKEILDYSVEGKDASLLKAQRNLYTNTRADIAKNLRKAETEAERLVSFQGEPWTVEATLEGGKTLQIGRPGSKSKKVPKDQTKEIKSKPKKPKPPDDEGGGGAPPPSGGGRKSLTPAEIRERHAKRVQERDSFVQKNDGKEVSFDTKSGSILIHKSTQESGKWQITWMSKTKGGGEIPGGHTVADTYAKAIKEAHQHHGIDLSKPQFAKSTATGKPRVATTHSGVGTVEAMLDGESVFAAEWDAKIAGEFNKSHGTAHPAADVSKVSSAAVKESKPDLLHNSPSCKNASACKTVATADKADLASAKAVARLIKDTKPPAVSIENVPRYAETELMGLITKELDAAGYKWRIVQHNATDYGAAMDRSRFILQAVKEGELPPLPNKKPAGDWYPLVRDLLDKAPDAKLPKVEGQRIQQMIDKGRLDPSKPIISMGGSAYKNTWSAANSGGPAPTLKAANEVPRIILPDGTVKRVTPRMMARLMGLPDSFRVPENPRMAKTVLGNGVHGAVTDALIKPLLHRKVGERKTTTQGGGGGTGKKGPLQQALLDMTEETKNLGKGEGEAGSIQLAPGRRTRRGRQSKERENPEGGQSRYRSREDYATEEGQRFIEEHESPTIEGYDAKAEGTFRTFRLLKKDKPFFGDAIEKLRQGMTAPKDAKAVARSFLGMVTKNLVPKDYDLMRRSVIFRDLLETAEKIAEQEGVRVEQVAGGLTLDQVKAEVAHHDRLLADRPEAQAAVERHYKLTRALRDELVERGALSEIDGYDFYYPHIVLKHRAERGTGGGGAGALRKPKRQYTRHRGDVKLEGKERSTEPGAIWTNYIEAMYESVSNVIRDNIIDDVIYRAAESYDIRARPRGGAKLPEKWKEGDPLPDGYTLYEHDPGLTYHPKGILSATEATKITQYLARDLELLEAMGIDKQAFARARRVFSRAIEQKKKDKPAWVVTGKKPALVIPRELAATLESYRSEYFYVPPNTLLTKINRTFKGYVLKKNPVRYNRRNFVGDAERLFASMGMAPFRMIPLAMRELIYARQGKLDIQRKTWDQKSTWYQLAEERGVIDSGRFAQEVGRTIETPELRHLIEGDKMDQLLALKDPKKLIRFISERIQEVSEYRENVLRLASFYENMSRLEQGKKLLEGVSDIRGITDPIDAVAKISRETLGDYGNMTKFENRMRNGLVPFYSWMKINNQFWGSLALHQGPKGVAKKVGTATSVNALRARTWIGLAGIYSAVSVWNEAVMGEFEADTPMHQRGQFHIQLGMRDEHGNPIIITEPTALDDLLRFWGFQGVTPGWRDVLAGRRTVKEFLDSIREDTMFGGVVPGKAPVMNAISAVGPPWSTIGASVGIQTFPQIGYIEEGKGRFAEAVSTLGLSETKRAIQEKPFNPAHWLVEGAKVWGESLDLHHGMMPIKSHGLRPDYYEMRQQLRDKHSQWKGMVQRGEKDDALEFARKNARFFAQNSEGKFKMSAVFYEADKRIQKIKREMLKPGADVSDLNGQIDAIVQMAMHRFREIPGTYKGAK